MHSKSNQADLVIIGGGLIGYSLIAALKPAIQNGMKITLLEASNPNTSTKEYSPAFDQRSTAISLGSAKLLQKWGLWQSFSQQATEVKYIEVTEQSRFHTLQMEPKSKDKALGYILPNNWMGQCLLSEVTDLDVDIRYQSQVDHVQFEQDSANVILSNGEKISGSMVIVADGGRSNIKTQLGIQTDQLDFNQTAIVVNIETEQPHLNRAYERFTEIGPMAMLPLEHNKLALVWSVSPDTAQSIAQMNDQEFLKFGQAEFGNRLGQWIKASERFSYPIIRKHSAEQVRSRIALIGNSAISLHPLAGQGLNLGLRAVSALSQRLIPQFENHRLGQLTELLEFQAEIKPDQLQVTKFCDALVNIHSNQALYHIRNWAMGILDHHHISKSVFMKKAMGTSAEQQYEIQTTALTDKKLKSILG